VNGCFVLFELLSCFGLRDMFFSSFVGNNFISIGGSRFCNYQNWHKDDNGFVKREIKEC